MLLELGYQVVCPDIMGFGGTDAPLAPPESMAFYSYKRAADDIKELARQLGVSKAILGGHDWGGAIVYRIALCKRSFGTFCLTPKLYVELQDMILSFCYQSRFFTRTLLSQEY